MNIKTIIYAEGNSKIGYIGNDKLYIQGAPMLESIHNVDEIIILFRENLNWEWLKKNIYPMTIVKKGKIRFLHNTIMGIQEEML